MTQTLASMKRKIKSASELYAVVETMKTMAAVNVGIYERVYHSLADYHQTIEAGISAILRQSPPHISLRQPASNAATAIIVFGSDQGMVGQYNDRLASALLERFPLAKQPPVIWSIGERIAGKLQDDLPVTKTYRVPDSAAGIASLIGNLLLTLVAQRFSRLLLLHNKPQGSIGYEPVCQQLLPLDTHWLFDLAKRPWPSQALPEVNQTPDAAFSLFYQEYIFITLCRASAEALVSENISRLAAMQRAEKNIEELLELLQQDYNQERQSSITAELFDVIFGYTTLADKKQG
ncbi:F0F1 ATP synthase subunit gamma [Azotosporobacter soli]|uniref:F0F1 ATP synthase subunit gamma n=1 Tax=Azotosporobacter soli TaxID=3055040 RepID=UPI0031FF44B4